MSISFPGLFDTLPSHPGSCPLCHHVNNHTPRCGYGDCRCGQPGTPPAQAHSPTSRAAAEAIKETASTLRERVYRCILTSGPITDRSIQEALGMAGDTERPRRRELQKAGRIVHGGKVVEHGREAETWVVA